MSIAYNTGIPAANNNPSTDQPNMLINTNSINSWVGIDHIGFNVGGSQVSGQHAQVTYNAPLGSDPNKVSPISSLYTKTATNPATTQLFFQNGSLASNVIQITGSNFVTPGFGYVGGLLFQWGSVSINNGTNSSAVTNFPIAFPNAIFTMVVTPQTNIAADAQATSYQLTGLTQFQIFRNGTAGTVGQSWLAIGF